MATGAVYQAQQTAKASRFNEKVAQQNAQASLDAAAAGERRQRIMAHKQLGQIRANAGASRLSLEGSPADVLAQSAAAADLDALTIRHQGLTQQRSFSNEATLEGMRVPSASTGAYISAAGTLLGGAGNAYAYRSDFKRTA